MPGAGPPGARQNLEWSIGGALTARVQLARALLRNPAPGIACPLRAGEDDVDPGEHEFQLRDAPGRARHPDPQPGHPDERSTPVVASWTLRPWTSSETWPSVMAR